jgi:hypothetical protein
MEHYIIIKVIGFILLLLAYFMLQQKKLKSQSTLFNLLNLFGAGGVLYSYFYVFSLEGFIFFAVWIVITFFALFKWDRSVDKT